MLAFKTKGSVVIVAFLVVLLFAISESKRGGGGGGRIFRTTILKSRRNSRRGRDLYALQKLHGTDTLEILTKTPNENLGTSQKSLTSSNNENSFIDKLSYEIIDQKKKSQNHVEDLFILQKRPLNWNNKMSFKAQEHINKNPEEDDENNPETQDLLRNGDNYLFEILRRAQIESSRIIPREKSNDINSLRFQRNIDEVKRPLVP